jgi:glycosyltransferase involved in cell wall biosynthesis
MIEYLFWILVSVFLIVFIIESCSDTKQYNLSVLAIAKNEGMVVEEFIQHYKEQKVDHVYLIDNGSTDDMVEKLQPFVNQGYVTVWSLPEPQKQMVHYNAVYPYIKSNTKWLLVADVDEYLFGVKQPLGDFVLETDELCFRVDWTIFGSSQLRQQPKLIRKNFIHRQSTEFNNECKAMFQTDYVSNLNIHTHKYTASIPPKTVKPLDSELRLHHYAIMSWEYFETIKMSRGDAMTVVNTRNKDYFERFDLNCTTIDTTLSELKYKCLGS